MARLYLPQVWTRNPQNQALLDNRNPLTKGIIDCLLPIGGQWKSVPWALGKPDVTTAQDQTVWTHTNAPEFKLGQHGQSYRYIRGSSQYSSRSSAPLTQVTECAALGVITTNAIEGSGNPYFAYGSSASNNPLFMLGNGGPGNVQFRTRDTANVDQTLTGSGGLLTAGSGPHVLIGTRSQVQNFHRVYDNGRLVGSAAATTQTAASFNRSAVAGLLRASVALNQDIEAAFMFVVWNRALTDVECNLLSVNPWQIFAPQRRLVFVDTVAGGAANTNVTLSPASFTYTPASLSANTNRLVSLTGTSFTYTPNSLTAVTSRKATLSPVSYSYSVNSLSAVTGRKVTLSPTSFAYTPNSLTTQLTRKATLSPVSWSWTINDLTAVFVGKTAYTVTLSPASFAFTPVSLDALYASPLSTVARGKTGPKAGPFRGPYDLSKRRWIVRDTKRHEDEAHKALLEAQQALDAAQEATKAKARRDAIAKVFRSLEAINGAEAEIQDAKAAIAEAQGVKAIRAELQDLERLIKDAMDEVNEMRRKRRQEEEDFIMRLLLN